MATIKQEPDAAPCGGIELHTAHTLNGIKVAILLEELKEGYGKEYTVFVMNGSERETMKHWWIRIAPGGKVPCVIDRDQGRYAITEGHAILNYLTRHYDPALQYSFADPLEACAAEQWISWLHAGLGPAQAEAASFYRFAPDRQLGPTYYFYYKLKRYYNELNNHLAQRGYLAGLEGGRYSIADIAVWPFVDAIGVAGMELESYPNVHRWWRSVRERPAVGRGMRVPGGRPFVYSYEVGQRWAVDDPGGMRNAERPFRDALEAARQRFGD